MAGRVLQKAFEQEPQDVMTFELLPGLDGRKMSKTYGNTINIDDAPKDQFGKIMSIPDDFIIKYFFGFTQLPSADIQEIKAQLKKGQNPVDKNVCRALLLSNVWNRNEVTSVEVPIQPGMNLCMDFVISPSLASINVLRKEYKVYLEDMSTLCQDKAMADDVS